MNSSGALRKAELLALWTSSDGCDPLTQWFTNISSTLSLLGSQLLPFSLNSIQSHQITARAGDEGQTSFEKLTLFTHTRKGVPTTNQDRLASFVQLTQYSNLGSSHFRGLIMSPVCDLQYILRSYFQECFISCLFDPVSLNPLRVFLLVFPHIPFYFITAGIHKVTVCKNSCLLVFITEVNLP